MTYSVRDYNRRDISSYFNQTDVIVDGRAGTITDTNGTNGLFLPTGSTSSRVVGMNDIQWEGKYPSRIITQVNGHNVFLLAGVLGTRTYKKGLTRENFGYLKVRKPSRVSGLFAEVPHGIPRNYNLDNVYSAYLNSLSDLYSAPIHTEEEYVENAKVVLSDFGKPTAQLGNNAVVYLSSRSLIGVQWAEHMNQFVVERVPIGDYTSALTEMYRKLYKDKDNG